MTSEHRKTASMGVSARAVSSHRTIIWTAALTLPLWGLLYYQLVSRPGADLRGLEAPAVRCIKALRAGLASDTACREYQSKLGWRTLLPRNRHINRKLRDRVVYDRGYRKLLLATTSESSLEARREAANELVRRARWRDFGLQRDLEKLGALTTLASIARHSRNSRQLWSSLRAQLLNGVFDPPDGAWLARLPQLDSAQHPLEVRKTVWPQTVGALLCLSGRRKEGLAFFVRAQRLINLSGAMFDRRLNAAMLACGGDVSSYRSKLNSTLEVLQAGTDGRLGATLLQRLTRPFSTMDRDTTMHYLIVLLAQREISTKTILSALARNPGLRGRFPTWRLDAWRLQQSAQRLSSIARELKLKRPKAADLASLQQGAARLWALTANAWAALGRNSRSRLALKEVVRLRPGQLPLAMLARFYLRPQKRLIQETTRLLKANPNSSPDQLSEVLRIHATELMRRGEYQRALSLSRRAYKQGLEALSAKPDSRKRDSITKHAVSAAWLVAVLSHKLGISVRIPRLPAAPESSPKPGSGLEANLAQLSWWLSRVRQRNPKLRKTARCEARFRRSQLTYDVLPAAMYLIGELARDTNPEVFLDKIFADHGGLKLIPYMKIRALAARFRGDSKTESLWTTRRTKLTAMIRSYADAVLAHYARML